MGTLEWTPGEPETPPIKGRKFFWVESHLVAFNSFSKGVDQREISETEALYSFQRVSC